MNCCGGTIVADPRATIVYHSSHGDTSEPEKLLKKKLKFDGYVDQPISGREMKLEDFSYLKC